VSTIRRFVIIALMVLSGFAGTAGAYYRLANEGKLGLNMYSIERILSLEEDEIDLGTAALLLSRQWGTRRTFHAYRNKIDDMAQEILDRLEKKHIHKDYHAIPVINEYLFDELGFTPVETADDPEDLFLHTVIDERRGYCLSLSVLYLALAERIGLPMYGVVVPGHFFVKYDDGRRRFNIETTSKGGMAPDEHYLEKFKPPKMSDSVYMKNLTKRQTLGCFFNNLGNSYSAVGEIDTAIVELERAVKINPSLTEAHTNLGNMYLKKGWAQDAIAQYMLGLNVVSDDPKAHYNLANAYYQTGQFGEAIFQYKKAIELQPDFVDAYRNMSNIYRRQKLFSKAILELKMALNITPDDAETYKYLGDVYREKGDYSSAIMQYKRALRIEPDSFGANISLAYGYLDSARLEEAVAQFIIAIRLNPSETIAYFALATAYNKLGWTDDEIATYMELLTIEPGMTAALQNLGNAYVSKKMYSDAAEIYRRAIAIEPDNSELYYNLGVVYANMELYAEAVNQYLNAVELDVKNAAAHHGLAISYYMLKQPDDARKHVRLAQKLGFKVNEDLLKALEK
jgi:tetratricopeptide (TPR) repeat protein